MRLHLLAAILIFFAALPAVFAAFAPPKEVKISGLPENGPRFSPPDTLLPGVFYLTDTFCTHQFILVNNHLYGPDQTSGTEILPNAAANGADSVIYIQLTFLEKAFFTLQQTICAGDTVWVGDQAYHALRYLGEENLEGQAANGCDSMVQVELTVLPVPVFFLNDTLCATETRTINGTTFDQNHSSGLEIIPGAALNGCDSVVFVDLFFRTFNLSLGGDREISIGDTVCLSPSFDSSPRWFVWSPEPPCPDSVCRGGCVRPFDTQTWSLTVMDEQGCTETAQMTISVKQTAHYFAPNIIRPRGNLGENGFFFIGADGSVANIRRMTIADRWGSVVFQKENFAPNKPDEGWDGSIKGRKAPPGVYVFLLELELPNGKIERGKGNVSVVW